MAPTKAQPELDKRKHLLGTMPDAKIAEQAGVSSAIVGRYRRSLGIASFKARNAGGATEAPTQQPDAAPATPPKRRRKSKIDPYVELLGQTPDSEIAKLAGVTTEAVRMYRRRRGVAPASRRKAERPARKPGRRRSRLDPFYELLGKLPDAEIAEKAGVTAENVRAYRSRHGIQAQYRVRRGRKRKDAAVASSTAAATPTVTAKAETAAPETAAPVVAAPLAQPPAAPSAAPKIPAVDRGHGFAWAVSVSADDTPWVVNAPSLDVAAQLAVVAMAQRNPTAVVQGIRRLGRTLA